MILTKTVEVSDYDLIKNEVLQLKDCHKILTGCGVKIDIGHEHRFWEYGMALKAYHDWNELDSPRIIDVGAGLSLLGPSLAWGEDLEVTEVEPNSSYWNDRNIICNGILQDLKKPKINWRGMSLNLFRETFSTSFYYDVVFSISVIEHVANDHNFLRILSEMVKPKGLLFLTTDVVPDPTKKYHFDNLREHNYTMADIISKINYLNSKGFELFGESDLSYKGDQVFDYSFASICMIRK